MNPTHEEIYEWCAKELHRAFAHMTKNQWTRMDVLLPFHWVSASRDETPSYFKAVQVTIHINDSVDSFVKKVSQKLEAVYKRGF